MTTNRPPARPDRAPARPNRAPAGPNRPPADELDRPAGPPVDTGSWSPGTTLQAGLGFQLGRAHRTVRAAWQARIVDLGLSPAQAALLLFVADRPGSGLRELARGLRTDPMNAKRIADGLEAAGLVCSTADPADRRLRVIAATDAGLDLARDVDRRAAAWSATLDGLLGTADARELHRILDRLQSAVGDLQAEDRAPDEEVGRA